jgi:hypothetical protein
MWAKAVMLPLLCGVLVGCQGSTTGADSMTGKLVTVLIRRDIQGSSTVLPSGSRDDSLTQIQVSGRLTKVTDFGVTVENQSKSGKLGLPIFVPWDSIVLLQQDE